MIASAYFKDDQHWSDTDRQMMARALKLAKRGQYTARPNPIVGCVIVKEGKVIGEGLHQTFGQAHAEINALKQAGLEANGATCYVTLEPCAYTGKTGPCAVALVEAGVSKVIAAMADPNPKVSGNGFEILKNAGIEAEFGLLESQAKALNPGFISVMTRNRPWVTCKLAMSIDGRTALADGSSKWITGAAARADVQKLRARQDAVVTGIGTLQADNPSLNVRETDTFTELDDWFAQAVAHGFKQPVRVLLDRKKQADPQNKLFKNDSEVRWYIDEASETVSLESESGEGDSLGSHIEVEQLPENLTDLLSDLSRKGFNSVLVEAGHKLAGAFLKEGLIDELVVYMAPKLMGSQGMGLFELDIESMDKTPGLKLKDIRKLGDDIRLTYEV